VLDLDKLAEAEAENWVWKGSDILRPTHDRALIFLSRGGADAVAVREFNLDTKEFIPDGFFLPEARPA
jgi:prolyl oligopeptidase